MAALAEATIDPLPRTNPDVQAERPRLRVALRPEATYEPLIPLIERVASRTGRRFHLSPPEAEDLRSEIWVRLLRDHGQAVRRFRGDANLATYLTTVARNIVLDARNKAWGKWRPSAAAKRVGATGVLVDRLITRDGLSVDAAEQWLRSAGAADAAVRVHAIAPTLPARVPRRFVDIDCLDTQPSSDPLPDELCCDQERALEAQELRARLARALRTLPLRDQRLLACRYGQGESVVTIAERVGIDGKRLYRHFERVLRRLQRALEASGVTRADVRRVLADAVC
jgi:RNA polymerase sigma factor for flagellar operon FliA